MNNRIWKISDTIYCEQLTSEYIEDVVTVINTAFFPYENFSSTFKVAEDPAAIRELSEITRAVVKDGITVIAIDKISKKVVGVAVNKIQVQNTPGYEHFGLNWKRPNAIVVVEFLEYVDSLSNIFDHCQVDCTFENLFLAVMPEYKRQGIGKRLFEISLEIATSLSRGINVKKSVDGSKLGLEPVPKIFSSILTSTATQKIGKEFGLQTTVVVNYGEFEFKGKRFSSVVENGTKVFTVGYKKL